MFARRHEIIATFFSTFQRWYTNLDTVIMCIIMTQHSSWLNKNVHFHTSQQLVFSFGLFLGKFFSGRFLHSYEARHFRVI